MENKKIYGDAFAHCFEKSNEFIARDFTIAITYDDTLKVHKLGFSILNPVENNFSKKIGRVIALEKAKSKDGLFVPKELIDRVGGTQKAAIEIVTGIKKLMNMDFSSGHYAGYDTVKNFKKAVEKSIPSK